MKISEIFTCIERCRKSPVWRLRGGLFKLQSRVLNSWSLSQKHQLHLGTLKKNLNLQAPSQTYWIRNFGWGPALCLNQHSKWLSCLLRFESYSLSRTLCDTSAWMNFSQFNQKRKEGREGERGRGGGERNSLEFQSDRCKRPSIIKPVFGEEEWIKELNNKCGDS